MRTYCQGMRQRLAIAQAMLGLPDLLVLDEPTNGLDPPQIHAMREVLRRYAATGRTVLVSSHLLSEVEQTCTHVVVMHRGSLVAAGEVGEIVSAGGEATFRVDDPDSAVKVLRELDGVARADVEDGLVHADLGGTPRSEAVAALVRAGVAVEQAGPRRRLEDAFLQLVGEGEPKRCSDIDESGARADKGVHTDPAALDDLTAAGSTVDEVGPDGAVAGYRASRTLRLGVELTQTAPEAADPTGPRPGGVAAVHPGGRVRDR